MRTRAADEKAEHPSFPPRALRQRQAASAGGKPLVWPGAGDPALHVGDLPRGGGRRGGYPAPVSPAAGQPARRRAAPGERGLLGCREVAVADPAHLFVFPQQKSHFCPFFCGNASRDAFGRIVGFLP